MWESELDHGGRVWGSRLDHGAGCGVWIRTWGRVWGSGLDHMDRVWGVWIR